MKLSTSNLKGRLHKIFRTIRRYIIFIFLLFLLSIYGFLGWRVVSLNQVEPDTEAVTSKLQSASVPHIDQDVVTKIQQLQDNSVSVQSLFDDARRNPFQE